MGVSLDQFVPATANYDITVRAEDSLKFFREELSRRGFKVEFRQAPVDFVIWMPESPCLCERKTGSDFLKSLIQRSIFGQAKAMLQVSDKAYLIVENSSPRQSFAVLMKYYTRLHPASIVGAQQALAEMGVRIITVSDRAMTLEWLVGRIKEARGRKKRRVAPLRPSASRDLSLEEQAAYLIQGLPEMGPAHISEVRRKTENAAEFVRWINGETDIEFSTRIRNLRERWRAILNQGWRL